MFKKGSLDVFPTNIELKLAPATYSVLTIVPLILLIISINQSFSCYKIIFLILLLLISWYSSGVVRRVACAPCKMNMICPGSTTNKKKE
jgi:hypothetical protein